MGTDFPHIRMLVPSGHHRFKTKGSVAPGAQ